MDNKYMIDRLKKVGISFESGMSDAELDRAEIAYQFRFPKEIREFLSCGVPVGSSFLNYRDLSEENLARFQRFQASIERSFRFDLENNRDDLMELLCETLGFDHHSESFDDAILEYLHQSIKLIPFYAHRCFFDGMDDMPIVSFWQPTDTIFYGGTFENYLEVEFLKKQRILENIPERMKDTGIWAHLIG
jgi:hypothetical protein